MTQANCSTCFDLDFRYIPQPHKNRRIRSIGQPARHWISSAMLAETTSCESCKLLKSSFDALTSSWGISATEGRSIPYQIAIIEPDDAGAGDASEQEGGGAIPKAPRSLTVIMRCNPEYTKDGEKGGFDEEFEVEIYTPINSKTHIFWGGQYTEAALHVQVRHHAGRPSVPLAKCRQVRAERNVRTSLDSGSKNVIKATRIAMGNIHRTAKTSCRDACWTCPMTRYDLSKRRPDSEVVTLH